jgi:hypothetical protein
MRRWRRALTSRQLRPALLKSLRTCDSNEYCALVIIRFASASAFASSADVTAAVAAGRTAHPPRRAPGPVQAAAEEVSVGGGGGGVGGKGRWLWRWRFECDTEWNNKRRCTRHLMNGSSRPWRRDDISRAKRPMLEEACNTSHALHVTCHTPHVTRHTSHVTPPGTRERPKLPMQPCHAQHSPAPASHVTPHVTRHNQSPTHHVRVNFPPHQPLLDPIRRVLQSPRDNDSPHTPHCSHVIRVWHLQLPPACRRRAAAVPEHRETRWVAGSDSLSECCNLQRVRCEV